MTDAPKDKDQEKGDEILRRLLKTPPAPKGDGGRAKTASKAKEASQSEKKPATE